MEAAAYIAGERHTDKPQCVSPVITAFMIGWNDGLPSDAERDRLLKPLLPLVLHTRTRAADEETRAWMATDWLVRVHTPVWLDLAGLGDHARALRALRPYTSVEIAVAAQGTLAAARAAAGDAAGDAAWDAAWDAARAAARAAARDAAGAAARDAARDALAPTTTLLQASAMDLVQRMCAVGEVRKRSIRDDRLAEVMGVAEP
jgi:hypothetical protein